MKERSETVLVDFPFPLLTAGPNLHNSEPWTPSSAVKNSVPLTFVRFPGYELTKPGRMSAASIVPVAVPLLLHSSVPCVLSLAVKYKTPFTFVRL